MSMKRGYMAPHLNPTKAASADDIAWASGLYEGEGTCCAKVTNRKSGDKVYIGVSDYLSITQKEREVLDWMRELFGGSVYRYQHKGKEFHRWTVHGERARQFAKLIYPRLSLRRRLQIDDVYKVTQEMTNGCI